VQREPDSPWTEWLQAERRDDTDSADRALRSLFAAVPRHQPSAQLHERLLQAALRRGPAAARAGSERLVATGVVAGALAMTLAPVTLIVLLFFVDAGRMISAAARVCVWAAEWLSAGVSLWTVITRLGRALSIVVGTPSGSLTVTLALFAASTALIMLNRYLPAERR
jgi:hypothetical protein